MIKKLILSVLIGASIVASQAQLIQYNPNIVSTGGSGSVDYSIVTNIVTGLSTNVASMFVTNQLIVGNPLTGVKITGSNAIGYTGIGPFVICNTYIDYNTNFLYSSGAGSDTSITNYNGVYFGTNFTSYTYFKSATRQVTNFGSYWGVIGAGQNITLSNAFGPTSFLAPYIPVANFSVTNTVPSFTFGTNIIWTFQTCGSVTNSFGATNGVNIYGTSNGVPYLVSSQIGSTNQTWTVLLPTYYPSGQNITNMYTTNVILDFPSTSASVSVLPVTITGTELGDTVIVDQAGDNNLSINGTFSGAASNNTVFVRFNAVGAAVDPASQLFRITVLKAR